MKILVIIVLLPLLLFLAKLLNNKFLLPGILYLFLMQKLKRMIPQQPIILINLFLHEHGTLDMIHLRICPLPTSTDESPDSIVSGRILEDSQVVLKSRFGPYSYITHI